MPVVTLPYEKVNSILASLKKKGCTIKREELRFKVYDRSGTLVFRGNLRERSILVGYFNSTIIKWSLHRAEKACRG